MTCATSPAPISPTRSFPCVTIDAVLGSIAIHRGNECSGKLQFVASLISCTWSGKGPSRGESSCVLQCRAASHLEVLVGRGRTHIAFYGRSPTLCPPHASFQVGLFPSAATNFHIWYNSTRNTPYSGLRARKTLSRLREGRKSSYTSRHIIYACVPQP